MRAETPTSQAVSRLLRQAGHLRSVPADRNGYVVSCYDTGDIRVRHDGDGGTGMEERYARVIAEAGYRAEPRGPGRFGGLRVTARTVR